MARRRKSDEESVSLFPFLSILACVIGVLTLMITALALSQMDNPEGQAAERAESYERVQEESETNAEELEKLKALVAQADMIRNAREELDRLKTDQKKADENKTLSVKLLADASRLRQRIEEIKDDPAALKAEIDKLDAEVKRRTAPPEEAQVTIRPGGTGSKLKPHFVECAATGIVVHERDEPHRVRRGDLGKDEPFLKLLDRIADTEDETVIFLLRPDGVGTYNIARNVARAHYCRNGKLPILGQGRIDLSIFQRRR